MATPKTAPKRVAPKKLPAQVKTEAYQRRRKLGIELPGTRLPGSGVKAVAPKPAPAAPRAPKPPSRGLEAVDTFNKRGRGALGRTR